MYSFDLHVHTVCSGDSPCTVREALESAKKKGLNGLAITDHNSVSALSEGKKVAKEMDLMFIPGIEVSSKDGHILGLGVEESIPRELDAAETVDRIREKGGIAVSAHPFSLSPKPFSAIRADYDAIEVFNPRRFIGNQLARKYAAEKDLPTVAGSDSHYKEEIGLAGIKVDGPLDLDSIIGKIKKGETSLFGHHLPISGYLRRVLFRMSI